MAKIKWNVSPATTGPYRSFHWRGWPTGRTECGMFFSILTTVQGFDYHPPLIKTGDHPPLKLSFRDDSIRGAPMRTFKREFATMAELKEFAAKLDIAALRAKNA